LQGAGRRLVDFIISVSQHPIVGRTKKEAQEKYMELAQFTLRSSLPLSVFFGSTEKVANQVQQWYEPGAMDMLILSQDSPYGLRDFIDLVVTILQDREIFPTLYEADTLRGNLEQPKPAF
jgi:alkanesulfonate monooxygenase SsuD/methylene tetrahydromethanopterin reductase-like flavin-dependent oxidoreductase (luciferase family)